MAKIEANFHPHSPKSPFLIKKVAKVYSSYHLFIHCASCVVKADPPQLSLKYFNCLYAIIETCVLLLAYSLTTTFVVATYKTTNANAGMNPPCKHCFGSQLLPAIPLTEVPEKNFVGCRREKSCIGLLHSSIGEFLYFH